MATRLDQEIEQLENIVEALLDLCKVTWNGIRCTLPSNHEPTEPHKFPIEFLRKSGLQGSTSAFADQVRWKESK